MRCLMMTLLLLAPLTPQAAGEPSRCDHLLAFAHGVALNKAQGMAARYSRDVIYDQFHTLKMMYPGLEREDFLQVVDRVYKDGADAQAAVADCSP